MRKIILLLVTCSLFCSSCGSEQVKQSIPGYQFVVGVSHANLIEPWRIALYEEMQAQSEYYDNMRLIFTDAAGDSTRQAGDVEQLLGLGIDLLIISPNNAVDLKEAIADAHEKVPVIVLDQDIKGEDYTLFIGSDNKLIGTLAGEYTSRLLGDKGGKVLEISGNQSSSVALAISQGFAEAISKNPKIELAGSLDGDWLRDTAERRMKDYLITSEDVNVVFAHNDDMALGANIAADELRVLGISFIGVCGLEKEGIELVESGSLAGTFFRSTGGKEAVEWAMKILNGEKDFPQKIILDLKPIVSQD